jgi:hypothetical protein
VRYTSALETRGWRIQRPRETRYPLVPYPIPPEPGRPDTGQPPTVGTWADTGRAIDRPPLTRAECNRERGVFWCAVTPRLRGRCRPSPVTGRGTVRTANESHPRIPHRVCRWWAWNRPYQREATPSLPIETLRDWLEARDDAGLLVHVGGGEIVGFIPALNHGAFSLTFRNGDPRGRLGSIRRDCVPRSVCRVPRTRRILPHLYADSV